MAAAGVVPLRRPHCAHRRGVPMAVEAVETTFVHVLDPEEMIEEEDGVVVVVVEIAAVMAVAVVVLEAHHRNTRTSPDGYYIYARLISNINAKKAL